MAEDSKEVKMYKDGKLVATASTGKKISFSMPWEEGTINFIGFYMPQIYFERQFVFEALHRKPMKDFFNGGGVEMGGEQVEPVYFVHGRLETFRGNLEVTSIVLVKPDRPVKGRDLALKLPDIYKLVAQLI